MSKPIIFYALEPVPGLPEWQQIVRYEVVPKPGLLLHPKAFGEGAEEGPLRWRFIPVGAA